jgi:hypothetical protein
VGENSPHPTQPFSKGGPKSWRGRPLFFLPYIIMHAHTSIRAFNFPVGQLIRSSGLPKSFSRLTNFKHPFKNDLIIPIIFSCRGRLLTSGPFSFPLGAVYFSA